MVSVGRAPEHPCPDCGTMLGEGFTLAGLCPHCLLGLALEVSPLPGEGLDDPDVEPTAAYPDERLFAGQILGNRYQIRSLLGRGGMGEVWRAFDLKLRVDVALKALRSELVDDERALERLREEVRTAREVVSPNVCRVFDLVEMEGQELVSMEYIDGTTLQEILRVRSPLALDEAREIAAQFLAGLEAIHAAGLVHRDLKPENVMLTRSNRAVVMDFGIAKGLAEAGAATVAGTPAYMAPEQARGEGVDARVDVYSVGVMLAEMVAPSGVRERAARLEVWRGVQHEPPEPGKSPWQAVVRKAVARLPEDRYAGAASLARALEEVTLRVADADDVTPYPGLAAFTEADAEYFFGRELEVEALWKKLRRPHLLGLIGPSGAGKSSFLRAGLLPTLPEGWCAVIAQPGTRPFTALAQALAPELSGDTEALRQLPRFDEPDVAVELIAGWRRRHAHALVVVDQFEELFTQNPEEVQAAFAELLGRLALDADVHVLLSMRDDFVMHGHRFEALRPMFSEISPLDPPRGGALRRAIVQPALRCGYRFEDEALVEEMLASVEGERGALPMLAFTAARLWDHRDRKRGLLTRDAYELIGGVGGALAQHAEATIERIGEERIPLVRELFRNLVTAQGTRAVRDREELLSVFPGAEAPSAAEVLDVLVDARLLTTYEVGGDDEIETSHHRVEIVHESLLVAWPRLVRWRTQDADTAQLRDQVRQAAQMWEERGRPEDLLWTGTSFREYELWRERYEGGLSEAEERFGSAMLARAERQQRRRRLAITAVIAALLVVVGVVGSLWQQALAETRRAEASKLLALGRLELDRDHTAALAYVTASLELADQPVTRRFVLEVLSRGPTYIRLPETGAPPEGAAFSPDERWLAVGYSAAGEIRVWPRDGGEPIVLGEAPRSTPDIFFFAPGSDLLVSAVALGDDPGLRLWSIPEGRLARRLEAEPDWPTWSYGLIPLGFDRLGTQLFTLQGRSGPRDLFNRVLAWPVDGGQAKELGTFVNKMSGKRGADADGRWFAAGGGDGTREAYIAPLEPGAVSAFQYVGHGESGLQYCDFDEKNQRLACSDSEGVILVWRIHEPRPDEPLFRLEGPTTVYPDLMFDENGETLASGFDDGSVCVWDLVGPPSAEPLTLRFESGSDVKGLALQPSGRWVAAVNNVGGSRIWPLTGDLPAVIEPYEDFVISLAFTPDGRALLSSGSEQVRRWSLQPTEEGVTGVDLAEPGGRLAVDPAGRFVIRAGLWGHGSVQLIPLDEDSPEAVVIPEQGATALAVSRDGRMAAWGGRVKGKRSVTVWDVDTGEMRRLDIDPDKAISGLEFTPQGDLLIVYGVPAGEGAATEMGGHLLRRWNLDSGSHEVVLEEVERFDLSDDGQALLVLREDRVELHDLAHGRSRELLPANAEDPFTSVALDPSGEVAVVGTESGLVLVMPVSGGPPHLLFGHRKAINALAFSADGRRLATAGQDGAIRIWPLPDMSSAPQQTLPVDELLAKLKTFTNLRAVEDSESTTGWRIEIGPFPGWEEVATW